MPARCLHRWERILKFQGGQEEMRCSFCTGGNKQTKNPTTNTKKPDSSAPHLPLFLDGRLGAGSGCGKTGLCCSTSALAAAAALQMLLHQGARGLPTGLQLCFWPSLAMKDISTFLGAPASTGCSSHPAASSQVVPGTEGVMDDAPPRAALWSLPTPRGSFTFARVMVWAELCAPQPPRVPLFGAILPAKTKRIPPRSCSPGFSRAAAGAIPSIWRSPQPPAPWLRSFPSSLSWWPRPGPRDGLSLIIQEISARAAAVSLAPALLRLRGSELLLGAGSTKNTSCLSPK